MIITTDSLEYTENSIRTYTGKVFDLKILDPDSICIEDIAHALANTARFGGHLKEFYSVAQHSVLVAELAPAHKRIEALLHDASEAYLGDMPSPFKKMMPEYKKIENRLMAVIAEKFNFQYPLSEVVKSADRHFLQREWDSFVEENSMDPLSIWPSRYAEFKFLQMFDPEKYKIQWKSSSQPTP